MAEEKVTMTDSDTERPAEKLMMDELTYGKRSFEGDDALPEEDPPQKRSKTSDSAETKEAEEMEASDEAKAIQSPAAAETEQKTEAKNDRETNMEKSNNDGEEDKQNGKEAKVLYTEAMKEENLQVSNTQERKEDENREVEEKTGEDTETLVKDKVDTSDKEIVQVNGVHNDKDNSEDEDDKPLSLVKEKQQRGKSSDAGNENVNTDVPMDLSKSKAADDVIMLSDEEEAASEARLNSDKESSLDDLEIKRKMIKRLQAELRNEEAKLVLLKKLRLSQMSQQMQDNVARKTPQPNQHSNQPPPLVRGSQASVQQMKPAHSQPPQLQRPNGSVPNSKSQGPPPLVMAPRMDQRQLIQNQMKLLQQQQLTAASKTPQQGNLAGFRGTAAQADALRQMQQATQRVEETPAQRQAAAKLALRKQLEKTLLQIPPPKPPPPEMNFIPNLASPDFIYLLGLEEAVNFIIDTNLILKGRKNPDEKMICNPFTCVQCGTDFTPVWKREKPGSKNVICEQCVTSNQKKALKQEHTNRLKSAFVKALQQEQEIERMQSQEIKSAVATSVSKEKSEPRDSRESSARNAAAQAYKESMAETLRQHQNLVQAQAAALRMGQPLGLQAFNPRAPFPYQLPFAARASDLQRQYLLDMIPKGGIPWNT